MYLMKGLGRMKKIVQFIYGLKTGGAEAIVRDYSIALKKRGYEVKVLMTNARAGTPNERILEDAGIDLIFLGDRLEIGEIPKIRKIKRQVQLTWLIKRFIEGYRPDVLHVHLTLLKYLPFTDLRGIKVFYTVHNPPEVMFAQKRELFAAKWLLYHDRITLIALQETMADDVDAYFDIRKTKTLHNPVHVRKYQEKRKCKKKKRSELGIPQNSYVIGHIGRFEEQKNHEFLIDIFHEVFEKNSRAFLLMVGDGSRKGIIRKKVIDCGLDRNVMILSNRSDIAEILSVMDCFVFPSVFEGFGIALLEAQAAGLPCVVSEAVSDYVCVSDRFVKLSLKKAASVWAEVILEPDGIKTETVPYDIGEYDLDAIINGLLSLYQL